MILLLACAEPIQLGDTPPETLAVALEVCDFVDNDGDGLIDDDDPDLVARTGRRFFRDLDGDRVGGDLERWACRRPFGFSARTGDCDDTDASVHPRASEVCDGVDQDCDGLVDEGVAGVFYADTDGDGVGDPLVVYDAGCGGSAPSGFVATSGDCQDDDPTSASCDELDCDDGADDDADGLADCEDADCVDDVACLEFCDDGLDDDDDGLVDCDDPDCWGLGCMDDPVKVTVDSGTATLRRQRTQDHWMLSGSGAIDTDLWENFTAAAVGRVAVWDGDAGSWNSCDWSYTSGRWSYTYSWRYHREWVVNWTPHGDRWSYSVWTGELGSGTFTGETHGRQGFWIESGCRLTGSSFLPVGTYIPFRMRDDDHVERWGTTVAFSDSAAPSSMATRRTWDDWLAGSVSTVWSSPASSTTWTSPSTWREVELESWEKDLVAGPSATAWTAECDYLHGRETWYTDADGDGVGGSSSTSSCTRSAGTSLVTGDCDDTDASISPDAPELCGDGIDQDCAGTTASCGALGD